MAKSQKRSGKEARKAKDPEKASNALPNIVLLVGDDHGYPYFGFMGADYVQTPQMDKLAAQ